MKLKKMLSLLVAAAMAVTALTVSMSMSVVNAADSYVTSGKIGENASWVINSDSNLIISGTGDITKPSIGSLGDWGWGNLSDHISEVIVEDGITSFTECSNNTALINHYNAPNVSKVILPSSLKSFNGCFDYLSLLKCLTDIYVYSKNINNAPDLGDYFGNRITFHVYKDSETETSLREKITDDGIEYEYIPDNEKMPTADKTPVQIAPLTEKSGPAGISSKYEWNNSTKTLTFSGKGPISMVNYYEKYKEETEHIVINSGITSINARRDGEFLDLTGTSDSRAGAFYGFMSLKDIQMPDTLTYIGDASFYGTSLTTIINGLPEGLTNIGAFAFYNCQLEDELKIPTTLRFIDQFAFNGTNITSVNSFHEGMKIKGYAFSGCNSLKEVTLPRNIDYSRTGANPPGPNAMLHSCESLESIVIEGGGKMGARFETLSLNGIPESLCRNCTSLKTVIIKGNVDYIDLCAFNGCTSLTDIYLYNTDLKTITAKGTSGGMGSYYDSIDTTNNPTFHVIKGSTTEQTLRTAGYLTDENTEYITDTSALEAAITEAEEIDTSKYTDETVSALAAAVENGKALLENESATQEAVDQAVTAVKDAISALKEKVDESTTEETTEEPTEEPTTEEPTTEEPTAEPTVEPTLEPTEAADVTVSVVPDKAYAKPGDEVTYTVHVDSAFPLYTLQMQLVIPEGLTYVANSGALVEGIQDTLGFDNVGWTEQTLIINGVATAPKDVTSFDLATFKCTVDEGVADGTALELGLTYLEFCKDLHFNPADVISAAVPGVVTVGEDPNPTEEPTDEPTKEPSDGGDATKAPSDGGSTAKPTEKPADNNNSNNGNNGGNNNNSNNGGANANTPSDATPNTGATTAVGLSIFMAAGLVGAVAIKKRRK